MPYHTTHGEGCGLLHQGCPPAVLSFPLGRYCEGHLPYAWARLNCHLVSRFCNLRGFPCLSVLRPDCLSIVQSSHIQPLYASASRKQQAEWAWSLSVSATSAPFTLLLEICRGSLLIFICRGKAWRRHSAPVPCRYGAGTGWWPNFWVWCACGSGSVPACRA